MRGIIGLMIEAGVVGGKLVRRVGEGWGWGWVVVEERGLKLGECVCVCMCVCVCVCVRGEVTKQATSADLCFNFENPEQRKESKCF